MTCQILRAQACETVLEHQPQGTTTTHQKKVVPSAMCTHTQTLTGNHLGGCYGILGQVGPKRGLDGLTIQTGADTLFQNGILFVGRWVGVGRGPQREIFRSLPNTEISS